MYENQEKKRARAINAAIGRAGTGTYQIGIEFEFLDESGGITYYGAFSDAAWEYTMKAIRTAGFRGDNLSDLSSLTDGSAPEVMLVIEPEEYNGKVTKKVKFVNSMGGLAMKDALQGDDLTRFARAMKVKIAAYDKSPGAAKAPPAKEQPKRQQAADPGEPSPFRDDGIPF